VNDVDITVETRRRMTEGERSLVVRHYLANGMTVQQLWDAAPTLLLPMDAGDETLTEYAKARES
jgi:hypothetical protein